jgi:hypothetical protein
MRDMDWKSEEVRSHEVRLFPTVRISSEREAELRATASFCAMLRAVSEFGRSAVKMAHGPAGKLACFTELSFTLDGADAQVVRPDAVIRVVRGKSEWTALLEVKVGDNVLDPAQVAAYQAVVKQEGFDALITLSNQAALSDGRPPISLDGRRLRSAPVYHLSWDRLLSEAQLLAAGNRIADEDQRWMMAEWIRYVADDASKIIAAASLGKYWSEVLQAAQEARLESARKELAETVAHWDAFLRKFALRLRARLGVEVHRTLARADKKDAAGRVPRLAAEAAKTGCLEGSLRIPDAVGDLEVAVSLQARSVRLAVEVDAPTEGRTLTRVNWLLRQLKGCADRALLIRVKWDRRGLETHAQLADALQDPSLLVKDDRRQPLSGDVSPRLMRLEANFPLPKGKGKSTTRVLDGLAKECEAFYADVMQGLVPFVPRAPKMPAKRVAEQPHQPLNPFGESSESLPEGRVAGTPANDSGSSEPSS